MTAARSEYVCPCGCMQNPPAGRRIIPGHRAPTELADRLWARVGRGAPSACWEWLGAVNRGGYGVIWDPAKRRTVLAHVVAHELAIGPVPAGYQVDHVADRGCASPRCCNPAHLEAVTQRENLRRQAAARTTCTRGHRWTDENTYRTKSGARSCRTCHRDDVRAAKARRRLAEGRPS